MAQDAERALLNGTVTDGTGAVIRGATAHLAATSSSSGGATFQDLHSDSAGSFSFTAAPGTYLLRVEAEGFAPFVSKPLTLKASGRVRVPVRLAIASLRQEIDVLSDEADPFNAGGVNGGMVFEGEALHLLSNDRQTLEQQLQALAGGLNVRFTVDGFSNGRLPQKTSIRSIRINRNGFSAAFADFSAGRVEINTKPGGEHLHGAVSFSGTDEPWDARNSYTPAKPPFYDFQQEGNLNGPINRRTSFFLSDSVEQLANNAVVNASDPLAPSTLLSNAVPAPQLSQVYSLRVDREIDARNYAYAREEWSQTHTTNSGIAPLILPQAAFSLNTLTNTLQVSETATVGARGVNEARFQYGRTRVEQEPNSTLPSVVVESAFQSGGSPAQSLRDSQDAYEVQDLFELEHGRHTLRSGFRFRALREANRSAAGFNGQYIFADTASYLAGEASQFSVTTGQQSAVLRTDDLGVYAEDDWKLTPSLTFSYGFRFESESAIPDHSDPAPRLGFSWAVRPGKRKTPVVTLRGGYGVFYDRFPAAQLLQAVRENGTRETAYFAQNTGFNPNGLPPGGVPGAVQPTTYQVDPGLRSLYQQAGLVSVSRALGRFGQVSGNLLYAHSTHGYLTRNANTPLPGTFDPGVPGSGTRPLGTDRNVYQFASRANGNLERFWLSYRLQMGSRLSAFGVFAAEKNLTESDGVEHFVSNAYNIRQDYGRAAIARAQTYTGGLQWSLPYGLQVLPFLSVHAGAPFDITTGKDLNGDTVYNDRPALATDLARSSVVRTGYGNFDVAPVAGGPVLPRNFATSPGYVWLQLYAHRDVHVGPRPKLDAGEKAKAGTTAERPWDLNFAVEVHNLLNHNNPGLPVGVLAAQPCGTVHTAVCGSGTGSSSLVPSAYFGHSLSLAGDFSPVTSSNRTVLLQTSFTF